MRPIVLKGHERSITCIKFNREGDLLFSCSKANYPCVWWSNTGERLGTYNGHNGSVWSLDVSSDSSLVLTGSGDQTAKLWNCQTGKELYSWTHRTPVRWVDFAYGDRNFLTVTDQVLGLAPTILLWNLGEGRDQPDQPTLEIIGKSPEHKINQARWGPLNTHIYSVGEDASVCVWDAETGKLVGEARDHTKSVVSFNFSNDKTHFVTASTDHTCRLYDTSTLKLIKTYDTGRPANAVDISPISDHVILGGGQSADKVTTTRLNTQQFKLRVFHKIYEEELAMIQGHFGPVNCLKYSPDGKMFASGGEDGFVRLHHLDSSYYKLGENAENHV